MLDKILDECKYFGILCAAFLKAHLKLIMLGRNIFGGQIFMLRSTKYFMHHNFIQYVVFMLSICEFIFCVLARVD